MSLAEWVGASAGLGGSAEGIGGRRGSAGGFAVGPARRGVPVHAIPTVLGVLEKGLRAGEVREDVGNLGLGFGVEAVPFLLLQLGSAWGAGAGTYGGTYVELRLALIARGVGEQTHLFERDIFAVNELAGRVLARTIGREKPHWLFGQVELDRIERRQRETRRCHC